jgi:hypothetical protein
VLTALEVVCAYPGDWFVIVTRAPQRWAAAPAITSPRPAGLDHHRSAAGQGFTIPGPATTGLTRCGTTLRL